MRRLKEVRAVFKEKTGTIYKITWEEMAEGAKIWEKHLLESNEYPRAELDEAVDKLQEECFRYIDGDRAQQKLFDEDEEGEA
mgnify:CR=1 FL=1